MQKPKNTLEKGEQDALFALGSNFFAQGQYKRARIIFDGLQALRPDDPSLFRAAEECKNRYRTKRSHQRSSEN